MKKTAKVTALFFISSSLLFCNVKSDQTASSKAESDSAYAKLSDNEKRMPQHALEGIDVADDLHAELFASEPLIGDPTNIDVDARGRVWVCEAVNYRPKLNPENPLKAEGDRIVILEDTNGDGKADTSKVFYQGTDVNAALGVAVLGNKVIVSCSPNVFVFTDENGDDKPDKKELLFSHVGGEQHDHAIHAFTFGPDGKLYFNFGNAGEQLFDKNSAPVKDKYGNVVNDKGTPYREGMVFRVNTDGSEFEVLGHNFRNNYEVAVDAFGTLWQSDNDDDGNQGTRINYVMEFGNYGYTDEMTGAGWRARRTNLEPEIPKRHWHQNDPGSIPNVLFTGAGSPAGMIVYEGNLLPQRYQNQMIHCDAGPNIVRAYPVQNDGAGYKAEIIPILEGKRDQWFRPIDVCTAPDGSLFVADWYDPGVGGHQKGDLTRGRIYRITPSQSGYKVPKVDVSTVEGAIEALQNPNLAVRYLAWDKLHQLGTGAEASLQKLLASDNSRFKARALWLLSKLDGKGEGYIQQGLKDDNKDIRITALRAARQIAPDITPYVKALVKDADPQVRREAILALHQSKSPEAPALWADLAGQYDGKDRWYLEALGIGADGQWDAFLAAYKQKNSNQFNSKAGRDIVWRSRTGAALPILAEAIKDQNTDSSSRLKYFRAFDFINDPAKEKILLAFLEDNGPHKDQIVFTALNHLDASSVAKSAKAKEVLNATLQSLKGKQEFLDLVNRHKVKDQGETLLQMAVTNPDSSLGVEAVRALLATGGEAQLKKVLNSGDEKTASAAIKAVGKAGTKESSAMLKAIIVNPQMPMPVRETAVQVLARGWSESEIILDMLKAGKLSKELQPVATVALSGNYRKDIRNEALKFTSSSTSAGKPLPTIFELAKRNGTAANGQKVYLKTCALCHKIGNEGSNFGPALSQIGGKLTKEALYTAIIHPDAGISFGYEGHVFKLKNGTETAGIIASETEDAVEVVSPGGIKKQYKRSEIASRKEMENSMMPSNLHQTMSEQELVDLVEYLYSLKGDKK